jgi:hypothetical protein
MVRKIVDLPGSEQRLFAEPAIAKMERADGSNLAAFISRPLPIKFLPIKQPEPKQHCLSNSTLQSLPNPYQASARRHPIVRAAMV